MTFWHFLYKGLIYIWMLFISVYFWRLQYFNWNVHFYSLFTSQWQQKCLLSFLLSCLTAITVSLCVPRYRDAWHFESLKHLLVFAEEHVQGKHSGFKALRCISKDHNNCTRTTCMLYILYLFSAFFIQCIYTFSISLNHVIHYSYTVESWWMAEFAVVW